MIASASTITRRAEHRAECVKVRRAVDIQAMGFERLTSFNACGHIVRQHSVGLITELEAIEAIRRV